MSKAEIAKIVLGQALSFVEDGSIEDLVIICIGDRTQESCRIVKLSTELKIGEIVWMLENAKHDLLKMNPSECPHVYSTKRGKL